MPSKEFLRLNPDYAKKIPRSFEALQKTPRQVLAERREQIAKESGIVGSVLERQFINCWNRLDPENQLGLQREFRFAKPRRWKFDFAWPTVRVAVEVEGGVHTGGRHTRPQGFIADCDKYNRAAFEGYTVFRLPTGRVKQVVVDDIHGFIRARFQAVESLDALTG